MKPPKRLLVFVLIFQFYVSFIDCPDLLGQYSFDTWTTDDGLPQNGVREIAQTPDGYLWFTTFDGLVRFDGVKFTTFNKSNTKEIINNRFTNLHTDKNGTLYASTMDDGVLTVYQNGTFSSYSSEKIPGAYIRMMKPDKNGETRFLIIDQKRKSESWYYLRDNKFVLSEKINKTNVKIIYRGKSGALWTITKSQITEFRNGKSTLYHHHFKKLRQPREFFEDSKGALWISGLNLTRLKDGKINNFGERESFPTNSDFHSFWEDDDGSVWFANGGRSGSGIGLIRFKDGNFEKYGKNEGLSDTNIFDVFKDREGIIWLATNKGLNRLRKNVITSYSTKDGLNHSEVYPIYRARNETIWIGTTKGLNIYRNGKFENISLVQTRNDVPEHTKWKNGKMSVQSILEDSNGKMWIGVNGGIFIVKNGRTEMIKKSEGHHVFSIQEDKAGNIWAATGKGILLFNNYKLTKFYSPKDGLPSRFMTVIRQDSQGRFWFGGHGGLSQLKNGKFTNYSTKEGLTGNHVRSIYEDSEGTLWIGTYDEGLSRFKNGKFTNYTKKNGLYNNGVFAIEEDERGNFWISSNGGIYRVNRKELNDFADGKINKINSIGYGKEDGMLNNECNGGRQPASLKDKDGNFWFPTQDGIAVINPYLLANNALPPLVVIESATVERNSVNVNNTLVIEPGQKNIEIQFTGISLIKSSQVKFKYKLEGYDANWIDAGSRRTAYYNYLPPGNYRFMVKAANSDGIWDEQETFLNMELKPYFYQTNSFYLLCIAIGILVLFLIWQISVYQLKARERLLKILVDERTSELGAANQELEHLANSDGLTKVGNRRRFETFLADEWHRAIRFKTEISLILIDIDHFKLFNDTYGHQAGDDCLQKVAKALADTINRPTDFVARFGGEEFAIILGGTDSIGALIIAEEAKENLRKLRIKHESSETSEYLTISAGISTMFAQIETSETDLINEADQALYRSKENGRDQINYYDMTINLQKSDIEEREFLQIN